MKKQLESTKQKSIKTGWVIFWLIICFPFGLFLMWVKTSWSNRTKLIITALVIVMLLIGFNGNKPLTNQNGPVAAFIRILSGR